MVRGRSVLLILSLLTVALLSASGTNSEYAVSNIPQTMLENADVVYRNREARIEINSPTSMHYASKTVVTILRESGISASVLRVGYNKLRRMGSIKGTIYDAEGKVVRRIRSSEILDRIAFDGFSIYSDSRVKIVDPKYYNYPFTIEYEYDFTIRTTLHMPDYHLFAGYNASVERSSFEVVAPADYTLRYLEANGMDDPVIEEGRRRTTVYRWKNSQFAARRSERYSVDPASLYPLVRIIPQNFHIDDYSGSSESWESFGLFFWSLLEGKQELPEETVAAVRKLISDCESDEEKIARIYNYSQRKNRYVSIQIGAGGIIPFDAMTVDRLSYGDCKALSNYVMALLAVAGIPSHYTLVYAGERPVAFDPEFVASYFNHAILCVPNNGDTIWLETTNSHLPIDHLGDFTDDRYVLLVTEEGGRLVKTPAWNHTNNIISTVTNVTLKSSGEALVNTASSIRGASLMSELALTLYDARDRERVLLARLSLPGSASIVRCDITPDKSRGGEVRRELELKTDNSVTVMDDMMLVRANFMVRSEGIPAFARNRESPVALLRDFTSVDTTIISIPDDYIIEAIPDSQRVVSQMGESIYSYSVEGNRVISVRETRVNRGIYLATEFNNFRTWLESCQARDEERIVLRRTASPPGITALRQNR